MPCAFQASGSFEVARVVLARGVCEMDWTSGWTAGVPIWLMKSHVAQSAEDRLVLGFPFLEFWIRLGIAPGPAFGLFTAYRQWARVWGLIWPGSIFGLGRVSGRAGHCPAPRIHRRPRRSRVRPSLAWRANAGRRGCGRCASPRRDLRAVQSSIFVIAAAWAFVGGATLGFAKQLFEKTRRWIWVRAGRCPRTWRGRC